SFGDGPDALPIALTRGRGKLVLIGDVGTLARRAEWQGMLDHLDEVSSRHERGIITRLVRYLQGDGAHRQHFHLRHESPHPSVSRAPIARAAPSREGSSA